MTKDAYYFPHFCNARHDRKIKRVTKQLGVEGYGIYFMLLEILREQKDYRYPVCDIDLLADEFGTSEAKVVAVLKNYELFTIDCNNMFFSENLIINMQPYLKMKEQRIFAGKASAEKRKQLRSFNGRSTVVQQSKVEQSKVEQSKVEDTNIQDTMDLFLKFRKIEFDKLERSIYENLTTIYKIDKPIIYAHKTKFPVQYFDLVEFLAESIESEEWLMNLTTRFGNKRFGKAMVDYVNLLKTNYEYMSFETSFDFRKYFANWFNTKQEKY